jgi:UPF0716 protein FxsA
MPIVIGLMLFPMIEIAGFVIIGPYFGVAGTLEFVLASALLGIVLLRREGVGMIARLRKGLGGGALPAAIDGLGRMIAALLLIVPGFVSSAVGLLLLVPAIRHAAGISIGRRFTRAGGRVYAARSAPQPATRGTVIDADYQEIKRPGPSLPPQP